MKRVTITLTKTFHYEDEECFDGMTDEDFINDAKESMVDMATHYIIEAEATVEEVEQ